MRGRKPKPTRLKLLEGNPGKRRLRSEPRGEPGLGRPPEWLTAGAKRFWRKVAPQLEGAGIATGLDVACFAALAEAYASWRGALARIAEHGPTYSTLSGLVRPRPEVAMAARAERSMAALLAEFGLTPSSRTRLGVELPRAPGPLRQLIEQGKDPARFFKPPEEDLEAFLERRRRLIESRAQSPKPNGAQE